MRFIVGIALLSTVSSFAHVATANVDVQTLALQRSYLQTIDCRSTQQLTKALKRSLKTSNDLTARGNHASVFEEIMMHNPACFIQALNALPERTCERFAADYIDETFFYPRATIKKSLEKAKEYQNSCIAG